MGHQDLQWWSSGGMEISSREHTWLVLPDAWKSFFPEAWLEQSLTTHAPDPASIHPSRTHQSPPQSTHHACTRACLKPSIMRAPEPASSTTHAPWWS